MTTTTPAATPNPLAQLEGFLAQDPGNDSLRAEAFATALRTGQRDRAEVHLRDGLASGANPLSWRLHEAHWFMASHEWQRALAALVALQNDADAPAELRAIVSLDQAQVALRTGEHRRGLDLLAPLVPAVGEGQGAPDPAVQALWLRLLHHADRLDEALQYAKQWAAARQWTPESAGVASLAALDAGELALSKAWAEAALSQLPQQIEALVSRASIALAEQAPDKVQSLLSVALQQNPNDGRALSAWAFAEMLAGELTPARGTFERALQNMPEHIGTWHGLGWAALMQRDLDAARSAFERSLELDRNFAESHGGMAVVLARSGRRAEAEAAIDIAMRLDRGCMSAHYAQAVLDGTAEDASALQQLAAKLFAARRAGR
jgi:Tfp pilus assembly protein PilF